MTDWWSLEGAFIAAIIYDDEEEEEKEKEKEKENDDNNDDEEEDSESGSGGGGSTDDSMNIFSNLLAFSLDNESGGKNDIEDEAGDLLVVPVAATYKVNHSKEEIYQLSQTMVMRACQDYNR